MATIRHGIYGREMPTKVLPPILSESGIPVVIGTAPIHTANKPATVNKPELIFSYEQAVERFGYSDDWEKYTLSEFIYSQFVLYGMAPVILINVLDPSTHSTEETTETINFVEGRGVLNADDVIADSVTVTKTGETSTELVKGEDYLLSYVDGNKLAITSLKPENDDSSFSVSYKTIDASLITKTQIIGGVDVTTGQKRGLEVVSEVYPRFRLVPGTILAPGFSSDSEVAAILQTKARKINGLFDAIALIDAPSNLQFSEVPEWKNKNNITLDGQVVLWPKVKLGDRVYNYSTQMAGAIQATDAKYAGIPYKSPSNEPLKIDATVNDNGEIFLDVREANYLNGEGIVTAINLSGWRTWGNYTAVFPVSSDVKDTFLAVRRMFDWVMNTFMLTFWSKVDDPINKRLVDTVIDSGNLWLNGLTAQGALLGGRIEFLSNENPVTDIMGGTIRLHTFLTPPSPSQEIEFIKEYDIGYVEQFIREMAGE